MKITVEKRLNAKGDKQTIRLVYWYGSHVSGGKTKHDRKYEQLDLYLFPKPANSFERQHNKETLQLVEQIKSKRIAEEARGEQGFTSAIKSQAKFYDLFEEMRHSKADKPRTYTAWTSTIKQLKRYCPDDNLSFEQVNEEWVKGAKSYFETKATTKTGALLASNTASAYFLIVRAAITMARAKGYLTVDPMLNVTAIRPETTERVYLTLEEVKLLVKTECRYPALKQAFLFSCLTGLRWSDVDNLDWSKVTELNGSHRIEFRVVKTKGLQYLELSPQAYSILATGGVAKTGKAFSMLKYTTYMGVQLLRWTMSAGITKHVTFHSSRHTFAVSLITAGVDIYTVSKLMGHTTVKTTQLYADIIAEVHKNAMWSLPDIGL